MRRFISNLISLEPQNSSSLVMLVALGLWIVLWALLLADVRRKDCHWAMRFLWIGLVSIPALGGAIYALLELMNADWKSALHWKHHDSARESQKSTSHR
jgi:hypothetical protein